MQLKRLKLTSFRNYSSAEVDFQPGITLILGGNGAGKTSLLEAAQYSVCGRSFRTSRDGELVRMGEGWFRIEAEILSRGLRTQRTVGFEPGTGVRVNSDGGPQWLAPASVLCFSPDDLELIKGPPAARRRFMDEAISRRSVSRHRLMLDYAKVLAQRNVFLKRARAGLVPLTGITPWDRQLTQLALQIYAARKEHLVRVSPLFGQAYREISSAILDAEIAYRSQLEAFHSDVDPEAAMLAALAESWQSDMERLSTGLGIHRDDVEFLLEDKNLRSYGSQGEQRTAVLALLIASWRLDNESGRSRPLLLLDDVMSELDPERRRRLMKIMGAPRANDAGADTPEGQVIITAADRSLFTDEELAAAAVIMVRDRMVMVEVKPGV